MANPKKPKRRLKRKPPKLADAEDGIKSIRNPPKGFVSMTTFCERSGVGKSSITKAKQAGKFALDDLRWLIGETSTPKLYLHWERAGVPYVIGRGRENWPPSFIPPDEYMQDLYSNIEDDAKASAEDARQKEGVAEAKPKDLNAAKLRKEQLIIEEKEHSLQLLKNQTVDIDSVVSVLSAVAVETRQGLKALTARTKTLLAAESDPFEIAVILDNQFDALATEIEKRLEMFINGEDASEDLEDWEIEVIADGRK